MSTAYEIYVISNSDLFKEGLNAVAAFCKSDGFHAATYMGALIGIIVTATAYVKQHDIMLFVKWLVMYFLVFNVLLGVNQTVAIINTSDASIPPQVIDNVPLGIALPAHLITAIGYEFSSDLEVAFNNPDSDALQYHKTGMMFGSNLFRLSLASNLDNPETMNEMNNYVRSCVVGDMLINHKYSFNDLLHSKDIWAVMTKSPSPIRGIFINGKFNTCVEAATDLTAKINNYASNKAPGILAKFIPSHKVYAASSVSNYLSQSYQGLAGLSDTASNILRQNIAINAFRSGILNYTAETGSVAGMQNFANTVAMQNTRMSWATSSHMGVETLPLMQVVLLLMMLCLFPLIVTLTLIPGMGFSVFKNYIFTLLWLESWPIMFTILNMAMNFYLSPGLDGTVHHITLSNINRLAQEHSDIAGVAGYLILAIPFLSIGIVKGMAMTFNQAAQYLGGMMHSIGQSASSSVAMGNYSFGNVSTANATANTLSANKHDTNFTNMHGLDTEQLSNASTITSTPSGQMISNVSPALSNLATSINASAGISATLSKSADKFMASADANRVQRDQSISDAVNNAISYDNSTSNSDGLSTSYTHGENAQVDKALSTMNSIATNLASKEGGTVAHAFNKMTQESLNENVGFKADRAPIGKLLKYTLGVSGGVSANAAQQGQSNHDENYNKTYDKNISTSDLNDFRSAMHVIENYSKNHTVSDNANHSLALAAKVGSEFRNAQNYTNSMSADYSKGERLSNQASYMANNSQSVNSNFTQAFSDYVHKTDPVNATRILNDTSSVSAIKQRMTLAENFMHDYAVSLSKEISAQTSRINPEKNYHDALQKYHQSGNELHNSYLNDRASLERKGQASGIHFNESKFNEIKDSVEKNQKNVSSETDSGGKNILTNVKNHNNSQNKKMQSIKKYAEKGLAHHDIPW